MLPRRHPSDILDSRLLAVLAKYVPPIIAKSIVERARREAISGPEVSWTDPNGLLDRISVGVRLFAAPEHQSAILRDITDLAVEDQDEAPTSRPFLDEAPTSFKPSSGRPLLDEPASSGRGRDEPSSGRSRGDEPLTGRSRVDDPSSSRRDAPAPPASTPGTTPSPPGSGPSTPSSRRDNPPSTKRDTDVTGFATWRTNDAPPPSRGVYPTSAPRTATSGTMRMAAVRPSPPPLIPVIPPPPGAVRIPPDPTSAAQVERGENREVTVTLVTEHDIPRARQVAREICESLGTRALTQQRLVTIVSELGRNMVLYAGGGRITLRPPLNATRRVIVLAVDQGPGIANLSEIMSGKYKSRSGLGLGIVGTKRLADSFHIETGRHGTAISVEVIV